MQLVMLRHWRGDTWGDYSRDHDKRVYSPRHIFFSSEIGGVGPVEFLRGKFCGQYFYLYLFLFVRERERGAVAEVLAAPQNCGGGKVVAVSCQRQ